MGLGLGSSPGKQLRAMPWHTKELHPSDKLFIATFPLSSLDGLVPQMKKGLQGITGQGGTEISESLDRGLAWRRKSCHMETNRKRQRWNWEVEREDKLENLVEN